MKKHFVLLLGAPLVSCHFASTAMAHPGHDHGGPQTGGLHYLTSPMHILPILAIAGLLIGAALFLRHAYQAKKNSKSVALPRLTKE